MKNCTHCQNVATVAGAVGTVDGLSLIKIFQPLCEEHNGAALEVAEKGTYYYAPVGHIRALHQVADGEIEARIRRTDGRSACSIVGCANHSGAYALTRDGKVYPVCLSCAVAALVVSIERSIPGLRPLLYAEAKAKASEKKVVLNEGKKVLASLQAATPKPASTPATRAKEESPADKRRKDLKYAAKVLADKIVANAMNLPDDGVVQAPMPALKNKPVTASSGKFCNNALAAGLTSLINTTGASA